MKEQNTQKLRTGIGVAILLLLGVVGSGFGIYQTIRGLGLGVEIAIVKATVDEVKNNQGVIFKNTAEFDAAVAASINKLVAQKQQADIDQKYAQFSGAPDKVDGDKYIYGDISARFTLVEFSDLECPFCRKFHETAKKIVDDSKGNVSWQWKHMPLTFHNPAAHKEALSSECIAEQKGNRGFWVFVNDVFNQSQGNGRGVPDLASIVTGVGADLDAFRKCLASGKFEEKVQADIQKAKSYGVSGTPATFVVDNQTGKSQLLGGDQPAQAIMAVIRKMMVESQPNNSSNL